MPHSVLWGPPKDSAQKESFTSGRFSQKYPFHPVWTAIYTWLLDCYLLLRVTRNGIKSVDTFPCYLIEWAVAVMNVLISVLNHAGKSVMTFNIWFKWMSCIKSQWKQKEIWNVLFFRMPGLLLLHRTEIEKNAGIYLYSGIVVSVSWIWWEDTIIQPVQFLSHGLSGYHSSLSQHMLTWLLSERGFPFPLPSSM